MIAVLVSWIVIFFTLFSLGDIFICFYSKMCNKKEEYNIPDTFVLGICFAAVLLSLSSLWLPSNQYVLLALVLISIAYWACNRRVLTLHINHIKSLFKSLSLFRKGLVAAVIASVFLYMLFSAFFYDAGFYHYQQIRWNEEYAVIPGLANFEDRYGFNSNYLLLSSIFTFRFLFGNAVYMLQSLLFVLILCWAMINLFRSGYDFRYLLILILLFFTLMWGGYMLADTSTDIVPLLCVFYYLSKTALNPGWLTKQPLMAFLVPVALVTFKVSMLPFCLISLGILIYLIRQKRSRVVYFLLSASVLTITLWCIRNVIISGYLVYPMYSIDLFDVDWKVPAGTAALQKLHIYNWAKYVFDIQYIHRVFTEGLTGNLLDFFNSAIILALFLYIVISPAIVLYNIIRKKYIDRRIYYIYPVSLVCIAFSMLSAPDFRFANGYIFGCVILLGAVICPAGRVVKAGKEITTALVLFLLIFVGWRDRVTITNYKIKPDKEHVRAIILQPQYPVYDRNVEEYRMGAFSIYLKQGDPRSFEMIPVANEKGIPSEPFTGDKIQSIHTIEARGNKIQDGFRTKKEYADIINKNTERYIEEYYKARKIKYPLGYLE